MPLRALRALCSPRRELPKESEQAQPPPAATRPRLPSHGPPSNEEQCMARRVRALQECGKSAVADRQLQQQQQRIAIRARLLHTTLHAAALLRTECPAACARTGMAPLSRIGARGRGMCAKWLWIARARGFRNAALRRRRTGRRRSARSTAVQSRRLSSVSAGYAHGPQPQGPLCVGLLPANAEYTATANAHADDAE